MDGENDDDGPDTPSTEWSSKREEIAYDQAVRVIDTQIDLLSDLDDKAIDTIRLAAAIVGAFVALAQVRGLQLFEPVTAAVGVFSLLLSLLAGITTYQESGDLRIGPQRAYVRKLAENDFPDTTWEADFFEKSGRWIERNHDVIAWNSKLLTATQVFLFTGLVCLALSVAL